MHFELHLYESTGHNAPISRTRQHGGYISSSWCSVSVQRYLMSMPHTSRLDSNCPICHISLQVRRHAASVNLAACGPPSQQLQFSQVVNPLHTLYARHQPPPLSSQGLSDQLHPTGPLLPAYQQQQQQQQQQQYLLQVQQAQLESLQPMAVAAAAAAGFALECTAELLPAAAVAAAIAATAAAPTQIPGYYALTRPVCICFLYCVASLTAARNLIEGSILTLNFEAFDLRSCREQQGFPPMVWPQPGVPGCLQSPSLQPFNWMQQLKLQSSLSGTFPSLLDPRMQRHRHQNFTARIAVCA
jgi:hypothetical protein